MFVFVANTVDRKNRDCEEPLGFFLKILIELEAKSCEVAIFGLYGLSCCLNIRGIQKNILPPSATCNQIWLSLVVNDGQPTYLTKLKKTLDINHNLPHPW